MPTIIGRIPLYYIATRALMLGNQRPNRLTNYIIDSQLHIRRLRQRILDRRRWIERIREIIRQGECFWPSSQSPPSPLLGRSA